MHSLPVTCEQLQSIPGSCHSPGLQWLLYCHNTGHNVLKALSRTRSLWLGATVRPRRWSLSHTSTQKESLWHWGSRGPNFQGGNQSGAEAFLTEGAFVLSITYPGFILVMGIISLILVSLFATGTLRNFMLDFAISCVFRCMFTWGMCVGYRTICGVRFSPSTI